MDVDLDEWTEDLFEAICIRDVAWAASALRSGADVHASMPSGTPLHLAASLGAAPCVRLLLERGANPNASCAGGDVPLHLAVGGMHTDCISALLEGGADALAVDRCHMTALHYAVVRGMELPQLRQLVRAAPAANLLTDTFYCGTPLELAVWQGDLEAAQCLLEEGQLPPMGPLLAGLAQSLRTSEAPAEKLQRCHALYATLVAAQPLAPADWDQLPSPCIGLVEALPAVLERSPAEAGHLLRHLPDAERERLQAAMLCIGFYERQLCMDLPTPMLSHIIQLAMAV